MLAQMIEPDYEYDYFLPVADIDRDGEYTILDYGYLRDYYLELDTYLELCAH